MHRIAACCAVYLALILPAFAQSASEEDYYGTWIPDDEHVRGCAGLSEGAHFTVHRNYYAPGDGGACKDAHTWLEKGRLRISANCDGEEYTFRAVTRELRLQSPTRIATTRVGEKKPTGFVICTMPAADIRQAHIDNLRKVADATTAAAAAILDKGPQTDATDAQLAAEQNAIARAAGFASFAQFEAIRFLAEDIVQFAGERRYLELRHKPANVDLVLAGKASLSWLLPTPDDPQPR